MKRFTEKEIATAQAIKDEIVIANDVSSKAIFNAGEICMYDELKNQTGQLKEKAMGIINLTEGQIQFICKLITDKKDNYQLLEMYNLCCIDRLIYGVKNNSRHRVKFIVQTISRSIIIHDISHSLNGRPFIQVDLITRGEINHYLKEQGYNIHLIY